jgi:dihydroorotate dehydrogenase electron transfer subunit
LSWAAWAAPPPAVADLPLERVRRRAGGVLEATFGAGLPAAAPGQFVMVDVGDGVLAHPFTVFRNLPGGGFSLLLRPGGRPVAALATRGRQTRLRVFGPLGRPFPPPPPSGRVLVVAEGGRTAPLYELCRALVGPAGDRLRVLVGGEGAADFVGADDIARLGACVERRRGGGFAALAAALAQAEDADSLYVAGPDTALRACGEALSARAVAPRAYLALEVAMACGVGACYGCPVRLAAPADPAHPYVRACTEGPVFEAREVVLA